MTTRWKERKNKDDAADRMAREKNERIEPAHMADRENDTERCAPCATGIESQPPRTEEKERIQQEKNKIHRCEKRCMKKKRTAYERTERSVDK